MDPFLHLRVLLILSILFIASSIQSKPIRGFRLFPISNHLYEVSILSLNCINILAFIMYDLLEACVCI